MEKFGAILGILLIAVAIILLNGWIIMVAWGAVASAFDWSTMSLSQSTAAGVLLTFIGASIRRVAR